MFKKVLIANRGEIAVRVIRACEELGLETVAIYSEVDRIALHVRYADEAYLIGPPAAMESYLRIDKIIEVARQSKAEAIHPGYGFIAENPELPQACEAAGIIFIGPPSSVMRLMGDKIAARRLARDTGLPVVPGTYEALPDEGLIARAQEIGYPLLVKAAAGGGGRGMRCVYGHQDLPQAIALARQEARAAFGDDRLYLERVFDSVRHVEVQILADTYGNVIHLGERECSIQRRYQKVIEEAPSPALDDELRSRIGEAAVQLARAAGYVNCGTVEFLLDGHRNFHFLEMNARLQVEHPVTEMVTGVDIVREQLRIAGGRKLRYGQEDIQIRGWALECRILAEDPYNGFLPSTGRIIGVSEPTGPGVRLESGIHEGLEVTPYYDSLISKVIAWGETRGEAILRMRRALEEYRLVGVNTTIPFHIQIMNSTRFISGQFDTTFLEKRSSTDQPRHPEHSKAAAMAATLLVHRRDRQALVLQRGGPSPWKQYGRRQTLRS
jgi:acetyl-CoA carboxylase biotin carboxylase subunit